MIVNLKVIVKVNNKLFTFQVGKIAITLLIDNDKMIVL